MLIISLFRCLSFICSPSAARAVTMLDWVGPVFPTPPFSKAGWLSNSWSCQLRPKRCIAVKYTKKLRGLVEMDKQIKQIVAQKTIKPFKHKKDLWENTMDGSSAGRGKKQQLNFQHFSFLRRLYNGRFLCKHSADRGHTKSFQSILRNPVALSCFLGEHCSLMCQSVCTQTATVSKRAEFLFWHKAFTSDKQTRYTVKVLNSPRLIQSRRDTQTQLHACGRVKMEEETEWESFKKEQGSLLRQTVTAGGGSERVRCCSTPLVFLDN